MAVITVDTVEYEPTSYTALPNLKVQGGNNLNADFVGSIVKDDSHVITAGWDFISATDLKVILQQWSPAYGGELERDITFYSNYTDTDLTRTVQVVEMNSANLIRRINNSTIGWSGFSIQLIEVE